MIKINKRKGMTLIEVILAMAIFGIIASGFLSMFTSSLIWIFGAGNRGEAYSIAQKDVENRISSEDAYESDSLVLTFDGNDYSIDGGIVESTQTVNQKNSTLETFVPLLPTITLDPSVRYEGDKENTITIKGERTHFTSTNTIVEIYDYTGTNKLYDFSPDSVDETNQILVITLLDGVNPINLATGEYIIRTKTSISGEPDELSRAKYVVQQSKFIAVGDSVVYISANGREWVDRENYPNIPTGVGLLNSVASNGSRYFAVGGSGKILKSVENAEWIYETKTTEELTSIDFSPGFNKFYISGLAGKIYSLDTDDNWNIYSSNTLPIMDIVSASILNGPEILFAFGDGVLLNSIDGASWISMTGIENYILESGADSPVLGFTIFAGYLEDDLSNGVIVKFNHSDSTLSYHEGLQVMNDITYNSSTKSFIGVGDSGLVYTSIDGLSWSTLDTGISITDDLESVYTSGLDILISGVSGTILYSSDSGSNWVQGEFYDADWQQVFPVDDIKSITGK